MLEALVLGLCLLGLSVLRSRPCLRICLRLRLRLQLWQWLRRRSLHLVPLLTQHGDCVVH